MKSMKMSTEQKDKMAEPTAMADRPEYPWGLQINLDEESLSKLGVNEMPKVGSKKMLCAIVEVFDTSIRQGKGDEKQMRSMSLQITDMELMEVPKNKKPAEEVMYG